MIWYKKNHKTPYISYKGVLITRWMGLTLQMFCMLNPQMNVCEPNPKTTSSNFNRLESLTKIFCFHAISKDICVLF